MARHAPKKPPVSTERKPESVAENFEVRSGQQADRFIREFLNALESSENAHKVCAEFTVRLTLMLLKRP
jgi:hypothetical protein